MSDRLVRYIEWMSRGRRSGRLAYVFKEWDLPEPLPGGEWVLDTKFNVADELLRNPAIKDVLKAAIANGVEVTNLRD